MASDERFRPLLLEHRRLLAERTSRLSGRLDALTRARRSESDDDEHDPEGETLSSQWSMLSGLLAAAKEDELQAEDALRRLDSGDYGVCVVCHRQIPLGQLEARPARDRCVACAS